MKDTPPETEDIVRARYMALTGSERMRIGAEMFEAARRMAFASLPRGLSEAETKRLLFERVYGTPFPAHRVGQGQSGS